MQNAQKITVQLESVVAREEIPGSKIGDEVVFFSSKSGKYYGTGVVGAEIWSELAEPKSVKQLCDNLQEKFDVERSTCEQQVKSFIADMIANGIAYFPEDQ